MTTGWQKNVKIYTIDSVFQWFYVAIGVWVLIWTRYLTFSQIGLIYSVSLFASLLFQLPIGVLADFIGRKKPSSSAVS